MPVILPKDPVTASFTRAVNAGHAEAVARARMQQQQAKPVNTRPLDENANLHQAIARSNQARDAIQTAPLASLKIAVASALWPEMNYKGVSLKQKILSGHTLSDSELRQLFHEFNLLKVTRHENVSCFIQRDIEKQLTHNMVAGPDALITHDGYVIIGKQAYGSKEALQKAVEDLAYFEKHEKHLPALPYPIQDNLPKQYYPDVTEQFDRFLREVVSEVRPFSVNRLVAYPWFKQNFGNDSRWDLQVNHDMPGQRLSSIDPLKTTDQYAVYKGKIQRAGFFSNFIFGYASAAVGFFKQEAVALAQGAAVLNLNDGDNPEDLKAIEEGWEVYHQKHSM